MMPSRLHIQHVSRPTSQRSYRQWIAANQPISSIHDGSTASYTSSAVSMRSWTMKPFTTRDLGVIRSKLKMAPSFPPADAPPHTVQSKRPPAEAAVLIPLMNIADQPCVLLEKRAEHLRVHAGEVSFPGGKVDPDDRSLLAAALREAQEELNIPTDHVEILGMLDPPEYSLGNRARVWAFVGFVHSEPFDRIRSSLNNPGRLRKYLTSLPLNALDPSPAEVSGIIPFPLAALTDENIAARRGLHYFRMDPNRPYWTYKCGDYLLKHAPTERGAKFGLTSEPRLVDRQLVQRQADGEVRASEDVNATRRSSDSRDRRDGALIWGLSGWFLHRLTEVMGWAEKAPGGDPLSD